MGGAHAPAAPPAPGPGPALLPRPERGRDRRDAPGVPRLGQEARQPGVGDPRPGPGGLAHEYVGTGASAGGPAPTARGGRDEQHEHGRGAREAAGRHRTEHAPPPRAWIAGGLVAVAAAAALIVWRPDLGNGQGRPRARGPGAAGGADRDGVRRGVRRLRPGPGRLVPGRRRRPHHLDGRAGQRPLAARQPVAAGGRDPDPCSTSATPCGPRARRRTCPASFDLHAPRLRAARARAVPRQHVQPHRHGRRDRRCVDGSCRPDERLLQEMWGPSRSGCPGPTPRMPRSCTTDYPETDLASETPRSLALWRQHVEDYVEAKGSWAEPAPRQVAAVTGP